MHSAAATKPPSEAAHLRRVIEKQPACLMRVGLDGLLMAANDAALGLLGAQDHSQVLGSLLTRWIVPADLDRWRDFAATVAAGTSVSLECDITDLSGTHRGVAFYAVPLIDHHDDIPSMILGARDESGLRRLEASLREADLRRQQDPAQPTGAVDHNDQEWLDLKAQLQQSTSEREELAALLIESEGAHQQLTVERERLQQAMTKLGHLEQLLKTGRTHLQDLKKKADTAEAERQQLAAQLAEREADHQLLLAEQGGAKDSLTEQHQQDLVRQEREAQEQLSQLRTQLEAAVHDREQLASQLAERETAHGQLIAEQADLRNTLAERQQDLLQRERETEEQLSRLQGQVADAIRDREQLAAQLSEHDAAHQQLLAERAQLATELSGRHEAHQQLLAEKEQLAAQLSEHDAAHQQLLAERTQLQQTLAERDKQEMELLLKEQEAQQRSTTFVPRSTRPRRNSIGWPGCWPTPTRCISRRSRITPPIARALNRHLKRPASSRSG
jgi:hypothetical protein